MCGIVGGVTDRNIVPILIEGLRRLEYRGYDSAGIAVLDAAGHLQRLRTVGKVLALEQALGKMPIVGRVGIAHTRWATHGVPSERNAHPHVSRDGLAIVHNGIIENYEELREDLKLAGYQFSSETDTEVVAHRVHFNLAKLGDLFKAVRATVAELEGAYALAIVSESDPDRIIVARMGCPVVLGLGVEENFVASDVAALLPVTRRFMFLDEGDVAEIQRHGVRVIDREGNTAERPIKDSELTADAAEKGPYRHFMLKEIHEQPRAVGNTLQERVANGRLLEAAFGPAASAVFERVEAVHIVACGTSYHAGVVASYMIEQICRMPCRVEIASEYRYRNPVVPKNALFVSISQSGETADTLATLRYAREHKQHILSVVNVTTSSIARESDVIMPTLAGPEIGVASTKAFTCQLAVLACLALAAGRARGQLSDTDEQNLVHALIQTPRHMAQALNLEPQIEKLAHDLDKVHDVLYLGRGTSFPIALEGALKLKEISYIHAEGYAAGELKHGPIALIDETMPVIVIAPYDRVFEKTVSNMQEVAARGGKIILVTDPKGAREATIESLVTLILPEMASAVTPLVYAIAVQLIAYHTAAAIGTDVDQPRNLAKSVTVE